ncbi:MAG TPA: nitrile hydratase subunit beta [Hyphomicrobiaceae bacterium]|nr:nitrile hydratase subunit beta [Hyphomicrobiaceae bacterium]
MNGVHDMGGMDGFGKVEPEKNEPVFHGAWEGRVLAMSRAIGATGAWNIDVGRFGIERLPPATYLASSYYERWQRRNELLCIERGLVTAEEIEAGHASGKGKAMPRPPLKSNSIGDMRRGTFYADAQGPQKFKIGDRVRMRNMHPASHTRLPRFVRGHVGVVERINGCHIYPDALVADGKKVGEWLYTVVFDNRTLWGADADPTVAVSVEAFEPYMEPAA